MTRVLLLMLCMTVACKQPNPLDCSDGTCGDPAFPYCDEDGTIGNQGAFTCIAVECTSGETVACKDKTAVMCTADGDDLEDRGCEVACIEGRGCVECTTTAECNGDRPICDPDSNACRTCATDDECPSLVCNEDGTCKVEADVLYASPEGVVNNTCTREFPCALYQAIRVANNTRSTIRLLDGIYDDIVDARNAVFTLVGSDESIIGMGGQEVLTLTDSTASLRGMRFSGPIHKLTCVGSSGRSSLTLAHVRTENVDIVARSCDVRITGSEITGDFYGGLTIGQASTGVVDRTYFHGLTSPLAISVDARQGSLKMTNSVGDNVAVEADSSTEGASTLVLAFNTLVDSSAEFPGVLRCGDNATVTVENNILYSDVSAIFGTRCATDARNNIIFPLTQPTHASNKVVDPMLVNPTSDFHVRPGSPAIDAAMPTAALTPTVDFEGTARPQGAALDIGAYEYKP